MYKLEAIDSQERYFKVYEDGNNVSREFALRYSFEMDGGNLIVMPYEIRPRANESWRLKKLIAELNGLRRAQTLMGLSHSYDEE